MLSPPHDSGEASGGIGLSLFSAPCGRGTKARALRGDPGREGTPPGARRAVRLQGEEDDPPPGIAARRALSRDQMNPCNPVMPAKAGIPADFETAQIRHGPRPALG